MRNKRELGELWNPVQTKVPVTHSVVSRGTPPFSTLVHEEKHYVPSLLDPRTRSILSGPDEQVEDKGLGVWVTKSRVFSPLGV